MTSKKQNRAKKLEVRIPFSGFYESMHNDALDRAVEMYFDIEGDGENHIPEYFYIDFNGWQQIYKDYAKHYTECFERYFEAQTGLTIGFTFKELTSPREYNSETDRIFADIRQKDVKKLLDFVDKAVWAKHIEDTFTSYSGFISHYSNDINSWLEKSYKDYDHNEIGNLVGACLLSTMQANNFGWEWEVMEDHDCNGEMSEIVEPYISKWCNENPIKCKEDEVMAFFNIDGSDWENLDENTKIEWLEKYEYLQPCKYTKDLFQQVS